MWRKSLDSQFATKGAKHIGVFTYLLLKANWKTGWFSGVEIKPGSFGTSITGLAETLGESRRALRRVLDDLETMGMLKRQPIANRWTMITICKWDSYQFSEEEKSQPNANQRPPSVPAGDPQSKKEENLEEVSDREAFAFEICNQSGLLGNQIVIAEWADRYGKEAVSFAASQMAAQTRQKPLGYMRTIVETYDGNTSVSGNSGKANAGTTNSGRAKDDDLSDFDRFN